MEFVLINCYSHGAPSSNSKRCECLFFFLQLEEDLENEKKRGIEERSVGVGENKKHKRGLKSLVKSCVRGNLKTKD